jgi:hypothetical protein
MKGKTMTINVTEYFSKFQQESLAALKQSQDANVEALSKFRALGSEFEVKPGTVPTFENIPSPTQLVEMSFGFASQMLEIRKAYTLKVAQMFVDASKQVESTFNQTTNSVANGTNMSAPTAKPVTK